MSPSPNKSLEPTSGCIAGAMKVIGNKWTALILRDLASGPKHFGELEKLVSGINPRTLSQRLDNLEACGILIRQAASESSRTAYSLTPKGEDLVPIIQEMATWGTKYCMDKQ